MKGGRSSLQLPLGPRVGKIIDRYIEADGGALHLHVQEYAPPKEIDVEAEPVRAALLLEARAVLGRHAGEAIREADLRTALSLVPAGTDARARSRVLLSVARQVMDPSSPQARAAGRPRARPGQDQRHLPRDQRGRAPGIARPVG